MTSTTGRAKPDTRRTLLSRRDSLTERERSDKSRAVCERAAAFVAGQREAGTVVALYANKGSEVETARLDEFLRAAGFRVAYPRVVDQQRELAFSEVTIGELVPSEHWGLREPVEAALPLDAIGVFVLPGLAFDRGGGRIGWGKGHYDATLANVQGVLRIGLAFDCQVVDSVPREDHDVILDAIVTETAAHVVAHE